MPTPLALCPVRMHACLPACLASCTTWILLAQACTSLTPVTHPHIFPPPAPAPACLAIMQVKSAEPVLSVVLAQVILGEVLPPYVWLSLLPIIAGCSLAAMKEVGGCSV